jgi:hypothetical protein
MPINQKGNFLIDHEKRDFFSDVQRNVERIGDLGKVSDGYKKEAFDQFHQKGFHDLANDPDKFTMDDEMRGTAGREDNKNYKRMEYDQIERTDSKAHNEVMEKQVNKQIEMHVDDLKDVFSKMGYTLNKTASAVGSKPIVAADYDGQIID